MNSRQELLLHFEDKELEKCFFNFLVVHMEHIYEYFDNAHKPKYPESFPCIVSTEWYEDNDNYRYWSHSFIYKYDIISQLEAFNTVEQELGIMNKNFCTICGKRIDDCECDLWEN